MRVISGSARGRKLKSVPGDTTRPILDRVKESLFNIVSEEISGSRWLDLFAGTGQVGIEALSRAADEVVFVDMTKAAIRTIYDNLKHCQLEERARVLQSDSFAFLDRIASGQSHQDPFDFIFVAPPQYLDLWKKSLEKIDANPDKFLLEYGQVIVQIDPHEYFKDDDGGWRPTNLNLVDKRKYGRTLILFYELSEQEDSDEQEELNDSI
ncbi:MAG: 16S rRNA (guanine966-N2)-methyltransferase [Cellvibrionaceae bacterium]|jgi:16S rRNA (guanine966-N2)-methyltransferase